MTKNEELFCMIVKSRAIKQYVKDINFNITDEFILKLARNANISKHMMFKVFKTVHPSYNKQQLTDLYFNSLYYDFDPIPSPFKSGDLIFTPDYGVGVVVAGYPEGYWKTTLDKEWISVQFIDQEIDFNYSPYKQDIGHVHLLTLEYYSIDKIKNRYLKNNALKLIKFHSIYGGE